MPSTVFNTCQENGCVCGDQVRVTLKPEFHSLTADGTGSFFATVVDVDKKHSGYEEQTKKALKGCEVVDVKFNEKTYDYKYSLSYADSVTNPEGKILTCEHIAKVCCLGCAGDLLVEIVEGGSGAVSVVTPDLVAGTWTHEDGDGGAPQVISSTSPDASNIATVDPLTGGTLVTEAAICAAVANGCPAPVVTLGAEDANGQCELLIDGVSVGLVTCAIPVAGGTDVEIIPDPANAGQCLLVELGTTGPAISTFPCAIDTDTDTTYTIVPSATPGTCNLLDQDLVVVSSFLCEADTDTLFEVIADAANDGFCILVEQGTTTPQFGNNFPCASGVGCDDLSVDVQPCTTPTAPEVLVPTVAATSAFADNAGTCQLTINQGFIIVSEKTECGTYQVIKDCAGAEVYRFKSSDESIVEQPGHNIADPGNFVAVLYDGTDWVGAEVNDLATAATHMAIIVDQDNLCVIHNGLVSLNLGLPSGVYVQDPATQGGFIPASDLDPEVDNYQALFIIDSREECVQVSVQEAMGVCDTSCCNDRFLIDGNANAEDAELQTALNEALAGNAPCPMVSPDDTSTAGYSLAVAEDCVAFIAVPIDSDEDGVAESFSVTLNGCKPADPTLPPDTSMVVIPQSQVDDGGTEGTLVDLNSLVEGDASLFVGNVDAAGCLHVNVGGKTTIGTPPDLGDQPILLESFEGDKNDGTLDGTDLTYDVGLSSGEANFQYVTPPNGTSDGNCALNVPIDCTNGAPGWFLKQCVDPAICCVRLCLDIGWENANIFDGSFAYIHATGAPTPPPVGTSNFDIRYNGPFGQFYVQHVYFGAGGPVQTNYGTGVAFQEGIIYRICTEIQMSSAQGATDGSITMTVDQLQGDPVSGTDGTVIANLGSNVSTGLDLAPDAPPVCFDRFRLAGAVGTEAGNHCVDGAEPAFQYVDNAQIFDCS